MNLYLLPDMTLKKKEGKTLPVTMNVNHQETNWMTMMIVRLWRGDGGLWREDGGLWRKDGGLLRGQSALFVFASPGS